MRKPAPAPPLAISDFNHGNPGLVGGGMLANEFIALPYLFCNVRPPGEPRWGKAHKDFQRRYYKRVVRLMGPVQEMPNFSARVSVDPAVKDAWGIPVCRLSGARHPYDLQTGEFLSKKAEAIVKETGATGVWRNGPEPLVKRRPAPGRHLPHGQRPQDFRHQPLWPGPPD